MQSPIELCPHCQQFFSQVFAAEGLRTLVAAYKDIPLDAYREWETKYKEAR